MPPTSWAISYPGRPSTRRSTTTSRGSREALSDAGELCQLPEARRAVVLAAAALRRPGARRDALHRSEEHTSELQSHSDLVCRLLLEKKKKTTQTRITPSQN